MKVAVAGVEDVGHAQAEPRLHLFHLLKNAADLSARDRSVHAVIVRRNSADRRESRLSSGPEQQALRLGLARPAARRPMALGDGLDLRYQMIDFGLAAVEFDDQQRLAIERIAGVDEGFGRSDRRPIHDLHAAGNDPAADHIGDAVAGALDRGETDQKRARAGRLRQDADGDFGDDSRACPRSRP